MHHGPNADGACVRMGKTFAFYPWIYDLKRLLI